MANKKVRKLRTYDWSDVYNSSLQRPLAEDNNMLSLIQKKMRPWLSDVESDMPSIAWTMNKKYIPHGGKTLPVM